MHKLYNNLEIPTPSSIQFDNYTTHIIFANDNNSLDADNHSDIDVPTTPNDSSSSSSLYENSNKPYDNNNMRSSVFSFTRKQKKLIKKSKELANSSSHYAYTSISNSSANKRSNGSYYGNLSDFSSRQERYISISYILWQMCYISYCKY